MAKKALKKIIWEKEEYFISARKATLAVSDNLELKRLKEYSKEASKILDCGCGDGTMIGAIWNPKGEFWGVDISKKAISIGKKRLKDKRNVHLRVWDLEKLNFPDKEFDLVYAHNVLEHLINPEKVIEEMIRVTRKDGHLVFISPNYGSPIYSSPSSPPQGETLISRAVKQLIKSFLYLIRKPNNLDWLKVAPLCLKRKRWEPDWDTVVEPYLMSLLIFLKKQNLEIVESYSMAQSVAAQLPPGLSLRQRILALFKKIALFLGKMDIPPYKYFGPSLFVVGKKR